MTDTVLRMTLSDVARLADVSRPVVSMWRKRLVAGDPFPTPVATVAGREQFDALEIAAYLRRTGRGNTPADPEDVAAHASLTQFGSLQPEMMVAGLTGLLAITSLTGAVLSELPVREVLALANEVDPGDDALAREVRGLGGSLPALVAHAERLADASYSSRAAFDLLVAQQVQRGMTGLTPIALRTPAIDLVSRVARAVIAEAGWHSPCLIDPTDGNGDLLVATAEAMAAVQVPTVATIPRDSWTARLVRRRLLVHDLPHQPVTVDEDGDVVGTPPGDGRLHVLQLPTAGNARIGDAEILDLVGDLMVQLADESRVVVLGPAGALTDPPSSPDADRARDAVLRGGRLRAAVRLPAKLVVAAPRQHLALWVLGPAPDRVPIAERTTVVGDLSHVALDNDTADDLVTDVIAALGDPSTTRGHAYRFCRPVETRRLIPERRSLVSIPAVGASVGVTRALGDLNHDRQCRVLRGTRIRPEDLVESGRMVVGPEELRGERPFGSRAVDALTFPSEYPSANYTEPGDIIFCAGQQGVAAWVDREGGSVVLSPARPLRIITDPDHGVPPLVPDVIAADIVAAGKRGITDWKRWPIRTVPKDQRAPLSAELDLRAERRTALLAELAHLDTETATLINDTIAGRTPPPVEPVETHPTPVEPVETTPPPVEPVETTPPPVEPVETHPPSPVELVETPPKGTH